MKITLKKFVSILSVFCVVCQMGISQCTVDAGTISTLDPTTICVDGIPDPINVTVSGDTGTESAWIITDTGNTILATPPSGPFDLNGAGPGTCLIWYISHDGTLAGNVTGNTISDLTGCFDLSNEITVERNEPIGGMITTTDETTICIDGVGDPIDVSLTGNSGGNSAWVITDESLNILGLPPGPPFDLDGAGPGVCLIWHLSFEDGLTGAEVGMNAADLDGCYELSNSIAVTRNEPNGGSLSTDDETTICVDGNPDPIEVLVEDAVGTNAQWIITNDTFMILGKPAGPTFDLDGAGPGTCLIWYMRYEDSLMGDTLGGVLENISGCYDLSDSIVVTRNEPIGGTISTTDETTICVDGIGDPIDVSLTGNSGGNSAWVITDESLNILGLPPGPPFDLDGAGPGVCLIWHLSFEDGLTGAEVGMNAADLDGCYELSNSIAVTRNEPIGGTISTTDETTICIDGVGDPIDVSLTGNSGGNSAWVITDESLNILGLPPGPPFDLDGAGPGVCLIWHLSFEDGLTGAEVGMNEADLEGCYELSNSIAVTRNEPIGGTISTTDETTICIDGIGDPIDVSLTGNSGGNSAWVITDESLNILGLPPGPPFDLDGAGPGVCLIWHLSFEDGLTGAEVGMNAADLDGCYELSNSIAVTRNEPIGGTISTTDETTICIDGVGDPIDVSLTGNSGGNSAWVITDESLNILGLPPGPPFDLDGAGPGVCLIWHLSFEDGLTGVEVGMNAADLDGCYELSNSIAVTRNEPIGGTISTTDETTICIDGVGDPIDVSLTGNSGGNSAWVITDESLNILGLPPGPPFDLDGAGPGVCLIWHLSFEDGLTGAEVGMNAADLDGCYELSNSITVTRDIVDGATISLTNGETIYSNCPGNVVFDVQNTSDNVYFDYYYVITNENDVILGWVDAEQTQTLDLSAAPAGECHVWGWNSIGTTTPVMGDHISSLEGENCEELSDNFITVLRTLPDGGYIEFDDGTTSYEGCAGAIDFDLVFSTSTFQNYWFVVTDDNSNILAWFNSDNGGWIDLNGAPPGVCRIYGWNEMDLPEPIVGQHISSLSDPLCGDVSENWVTVNRLDCDTEMCEVSPASIYTEASTIENRVVVANRASGTVSVINSDTDEVISTHDMPNDGEPMYVVFNSTNNTYLVGDYNGYVAAFDAHDFSNTGNVKVGNGVFHMWMSPDRSQLWVNNEIDRTITVINPTSLEVLETVQLPSDLFDLGYKPHDVILMPNNSAAFVTLLGTQEQDYVIKYSTSTFEETGRVAVGLDPHVSLTSNNEYIYVAAQGSSELNVMNRSDLSIVTQVDIPNAHGLGINESGTYLYIGNIAEGGTNATYTLDLATNTLVGEPVDAPFSAPHNYAVQGDDKLYITHSGNTNNQVSIYDLTPTPVLSSSIEVGNNPFGLVAFSIQNTTEVSICVDGQGDPIDVSVDGGTGMNSAWVITDTDGTILGLPPMGPFDLDGAGVGTCLIWYINYDDIEGLETGLNANDLEGCFALSNPITVYREAADGGTVSLSTGATEGTFCAGNVVFDVTHETTANNLSYWYIITDDNDNILGFHNSADGPTLDLSVAPAGECHIWGWSYRGEGEPVMGENISTLSDGDCESISSNFVRIIRSDVTAATISTEDETTICVDGVGDPIDVIVEGGTGSNSAWVITDESGTILGLPPMGPFDLDGAGEGVCLIWYVTYEEISGVEVGLSANDLEGCFALSNAITVIRESANGGTVSLVDGEEEASFCAGDVIFDVTHTTTAENLSYWYIITDNNDNILGFHNSADGPTLDLSVAPAGECHIWGWSYRGEGEPVMGENISTLSDGDCESISSNFITITRLEGVEAATISTEDETTICVDGVGDPIDVIVEGGIGSNSAWVITDESGTILGLPPMGPFDLDGAGEGVCLIWYVTYEEISGVEVGLSANDLEGCFALSNAITVIRESANGGTVSLVDGEEEASFCAGDVIFDVTHTTTAENLSYWYIITDDNDNILGFHNSADGPTLDLSVAPAGECHIWGWSYRGEGEPVMGENISTLSDGDCESISSNFITITRLEGVEAATISTEDETTICVDGVGDPIDVIVEGGTGSNSAWVITDESGTILGLPPMGPFDLDGAGEGVCLIWYVTYEEISGVEVGLNANDLEGCFALSNPITVTRQSADGGMVALANGQDTATYCVGEVVFEVMHETTATALGYWYVITDDSDNILAFHNTLDGPTLDLSGAPAGECHVWGWSSNGSATPMMGASISSLEIECGSVSTNFISIFRAEGIVGGTISTESSLVACPNDGNDDIVTISTSGSGEGYAYILTDENDVVMSGPIMESSINFEEMEPGINRIYGLGYAGTFEIGNTIDEINGSCAALSSNFIEVTVQETAECAVTSTEDLSNQDIKVYPNPATNFITVEYSTSAERVVINILDSRGQLVLTSEENKRNGVSSIDVQNLLGGIYILQITTAESAVSKRIIITK